MKKVYICSPYRGDVQANIDRACRFCRRAIMEGLLPIAPHLYFTRFLDDEVEEERRLGMYMGAELLRQCAEVWAFGAPTAGMKGEIELARRSGIPVRFFDADGREARE